MKDSIRSHSYFKKLVFIAICSFLFLSQQLVLVHCQDASAQWTNGNNHIYQYFSIQKTYVNGVNFCAAQKINGISGYLVTITSKQEEDFILDALQIRNITFFLSATEYSEGNWRFDTGPEKGALLYASTFDKCGYYCNIPDNFRAVDSVAFSYLYYSGVDQKWRSGSGTPGDFFSIVCEFAPTPTELIIQSMPSIGGRAILANFDPSAFMVSSTKVSMKQIDTNGQPLDTPLKYCTDVTLSGGDYICTMPPGTGRYILTVSDGISTATSLYQYWNPSVMITRPSATLTQGGVITISGTDFGFNHSDIQAWLGPVGKQSQCSSIQFINNNAFTCTIQQSIQETLLPINLTINNVEIRSIRSAVYYSGNTYSYSCYDIQSQFESQYAVAFGRLFEGMTTNMGVVRDQGTANFLQSICPTVMNMKPWLNVLYNPTAGSFRYAFGPFADQAVSVFKGNTLPTTTQTDDRVYYDIRNQAVNIFSKTFLLPILTESWWDNTKPAVINGNYNFSGLSTLQDISIKISNPGIVTSNVSLVFGGQYFKAYYIDYFTQLAYFTLDYIGGVYNAKIQIDTIPTTDTTSISIDFSPPFLLSITSPSTTGDNFTITGRNFGSFLNQITYTIDNTLSCSQPQFLKPHQSIICTAPQGYGSQLHSLRLKAGSKLSQWLPFTYQIPVVNSTSRLGVRGGNLTISGLNFFNDPSVVNVMVGPYPCVNITFIIDHQQFVCSLPSGFGTHKVVVTVGDQTNDPATPIWFTFIKPIVNSASSLKFAHPGYVTVLGDNFENEDIQVLFGGLNGFYPTVNATFVDKNTIICYYQADVLPGSRSTLFVNVSINQAVDGAEVFLYEYSRDCLNDCSEQGVCIDARCKCNPGYILSDCSVLGNATVKRDTATTGQPTNVIFDMSANEPSVSFLTSLFAIREVDPTTNSTVYNYTLSTHKQDWIKLNESDPIPDPNVSRQETWLLSFISNNNNANQSSIKAQLTFYNDMESHYFYGETFEILNQSVSYLVTLSNWNFQSTSNQLEIIFANVVNRETESDCDSTQETILEPNFNEYQIRTRHSALHSTFTNRLKIDDIRVQYTQSYPIPLTTSGDGGQPSSFSPLIEEAKQVLQVTDQQTIYLYSLIVPYFDSVILVENQYQAASIIDDPVECPKSRKWVIPVAVVCSIVGAAIIGVAIWLIVRRVKQVQAEKAEGIRLANLYR